MIPINSMRYNGEEKLEGSLKLDVHNKDSKRRGDPPNDKASLVQKKTQQRGSEENREMAELKRRFMAHKVP